MTVSVAPVLVTLPDDPVTTTRKSAPESVVSAALPNAYFAEHCVKLGGGMQYFDAPDPGLAGYGHDAFFFTTAAAAQYQARFGDRVQARLHIDWMLENANAYGLMPERIYLDGSGCSKASPLSWCCAEFVAALLEYARTGE